MNPTPKQNFISSLSSNAGNIANIANPNPIKKAEGLVGLAKNFFKPVQPKPMTSGTDPKQQYMATLTQNTPAVPAVTPPVAPKMPPTAPVTKPTIQTPSITTVTPPPAPEKPKTPAEDYASFLASYNAGNRAIENQVIPLEDVTGQQAHMKKLYGDTLTAKKEAAELDQKSKPTSALEYEYAVKNGYKGDFNQYQTEDANRKAKAIGGGSGNGLTPYQTNSTFLGITNKYQADPIIKQGIQGITASAIADQVIADPANASNQLKSLYALVKNLDPDSAVREGEIDLANKTQSYLQTFGNTLTRIAKGRVISPKAALELANATKELTNAWNTTADYRTGQYKSQANIARVGNEFNEYLATGGNIIPSSSKTPQPAQHRLPDGTIVTLQPDGTYE